MFHAVLLFSLPFLASTATPRAWERPPVRPTALLAMCNAVTRPEIEADLGYRLDGQSEEHNKFESNCNYSAGDIGVTISIRYLAQALDMPAELRDLQDSFLHSQLREIKGLGVPAFELQIPGAGTQLHVMADQHQYLMVSVLGMTAEDNGAHAAVNIAAAALRCLRTGMTQ